MNNNDMLIKVKEIFNLNQETMVEVFNFGGIKINADGVNQLLNCDADFRMKNDQIGRCDFDTLESFLNGFIIYKRGVKENNKVPVIKILNSRNANNLFLKKMKIALNMDSEHMLNIFVEGGSDITKGELTTFFRKEDHKHYKKCNDKQVIAFLEGLKKYTNCEGPCL